MILQKYCVRCRATTPQTYQGDEIRGDSSVKIYKCLCCEEQNRVPITISPLVSKLKEKKNEPRDS